MGLLIEVSDELWTAIEEMIAEKKRPKVAQAMIEVLEEYEAEDLEESKLYAAAYPEEGDYDDDPLPEDEDY